MAYTYGILILKDDTTDFTRINESHLELSDAVTMTTYAQNTNYWGAEYTAETGYNAFSDASTIYANYVTQSTTASRYNKIVIPLSYFYDQENETQTTSGWHIPIYYVDNLITTSTTNSTGVAPTQCMDYILNSTSRKFQLLDCELGTKSSENDVILMSKWFVTSTVDSGLTTSEVVNENTTLQYTILIDARKSSLKIANNITAKTGTTITLNTDNVSNATVSPIELPIGATETITITANNYYNFNDTPSITYTNTSNETITLNFSLNDDNTIATVEIDTTQINTEVAPTINASATQITLTLNIDNVSNASVSPTELPIGATETITITATNTYTFSSAVPTILYEDSNLNVTTKEFTLNDSKNVATFTIDTTTLYTKYTPVVTANAYAPTELNELYTLYKVSLTDLSTISKYRFTENGVNNYINDIYALPIQLDGLSQSLIINGQKIIESSTALPNRILNYNLGIIYLPSFFNESNKTANNQLNEYYISLPYYGMYKLDNTKFNYNNTVYLSATIDIIEGVCTYNLGLENYKNILDTVTTNIKITIPYLTADNSRISDFNTLTFFTPDNISLYSYARNVYDTTVSCNIISKYSEIYNNYFKANNIKINLSNHYKDMILNELSKGVYKRSTN